MKKKNIVSYLSIPTLLLSPLVSGCSGSGTHTHSFVEHMAKTPTCTENGNALYYECETCGKYYDATKENEIAEGSWFLSMLGHDYDLAISGDYKVSYYAGDTFDTTNMVVTKTCKRENCDFSEVVTNYSVIYQNNSASSIQAGDNKVTIQVGELTKDVTISVNKKLNSITGLKAEYKTYCKTAVDFEGVTATSGDVTYGYFEDEAFTREVTVNALIGGKTYYIEAVSDGKDSNYEIARATSKVVVEHKLSESGGTVIGYKVSSCENCDYQVNSDELMIDSDISLDNKVAYGMNADGLTKENTEGASKVDCPLWVITDETEKVERSVALPRINYSLFDSVILNLETNSESGWGNIGLGINENEDVLSFADHGHFVSVNIEISYDADNEVLNITSVSSDGYVARLTYDSPDVISGVENLILTAEGANSRVIILKSVLLNHVHSEGDELVSPTDKIGYKNTVCPDCGMPVQSETKMSQGEVNIDEINAYGMNGECKNIGNEEGNAGVTKGVHWNNDEGSINYKEIQLPRVDYKAYNNVFFMFATSTATWNGSEIGFGLGENDNLIAHVNHGAEMKGTIKAEMVEEGLKVSIFTNDGSKGSRIVHDADIIAGEKSLSIIASLGMYRQFYLNEVLLDHVHENASGESTSSKWSIGYKVFGCSCYESVNSDEIMTTEDVSFASTSAYGMNANRFCAADNDGEACKAGAPGYFMNSDGIRLPRVNYKLYNKVSYSIGIDHWASIAASFGVNEDGDLFNLSTDKNKTGTLEVIAEGNNLYINYITATATKSVTVESKAIAEGEETLNLVCSSKSDSTRTFYINALTLEL